MYYLRHFFDRLSMFLHLSWHTWQTFLLLNGAFRRRSRRHKCCLFSRRQDLTEMTCPAIPSNFQPYHCFEGDRTSLPQLISASTPRLEELFTPTVSLPSWTFQLHVLNGVYAAADQKKVTTLVGLDISAAFDTIDHDVLLKSRKVPRSTVRCP